MSGERDEGRAGGRCTRTSSVVEGKISRPLIWVRSRSRPVGCRFLLAHPIVFRLISGIVENDVPAVAGRGGIEVLGPPFPWIVERHAGEVE